MAAVAVDGTSQAETQQPAVGTWQGTLPNGMGGQIRVVLKVELTPEGALKATMDSPDQNASGIPVAKITSGTAALQGGALQTMQNKWQIEGASAKLKGIKGQGTCSGKATPDGGLAFECQGEYTLPK